MEEWEANVQVPNLQTLRKLVPVSATKEVVVEAKLPQLRLRQQLLLAPDSNRSKAKVQLSVAHE